MVTITETLHHGNTLAKTETNVLRLDASGILAALDASPYAYTVSVEGAAHMAEQLRTTGETSHGWSRFTTGFKWNNSYDDKEQVRPFMDGYLTVRNELERNGQYPYNDSFVGRIEGLAGSADEGTAIYLLQTLYRLDCDAREVAAFGGEVVTTKSLGSRELRGSVLHYGFYMGGTGIKRYDDVRLIAANGRLAALPKGARTRGYALSGGSVLFRSASGA